MYAPDMRNNPYRKPKAIETIAAYRAFVKERSGFYAATSGHRGPRISQTRSCESPKRRWSGACWLSSLHPGFGMKKRCTQQGDCVASFTVRHAGGGRGIRPGTSIDESFCRLVLAFLDGALRRREGGAQETS